MNKAEPQPILLPRARREPPYTWAASPTIADLPRPRMVHTIRSTTVSCCGTIYETLDAFCGHCGEKLLSSFPRYTQLGGIHKRQGG
jgi:hypothetical protein